jgi:hypothetical protein
MSSRAHVHNQLSSPRLRCSICCCINSTRTTVSVRARAVVTVVAHLVMPSRPVASRMTSPLIFSTVISVHQMCGDQGGLRKLLCRLCYTLVKMTHFADSFVNSQEWTLSRAVHELKLVSDTVGVRVVLTAPTPIGRTGVQNACARSPNTPQSVYFIS